VTTSSELPNDVQFLDLGLGIEQASENRFGIDSTEREIHNDSTDDEFGKSRAKSDP
jgi:hypothetical protein